MANLCFDPKLIVRVVRGAAVCWSAARGRDGVGVGAAVVLAAALVAVLGAALFSGLAAIRSVSEPTAMVGAVGAGVAAPSTGSTGSTFPALAPSTGSISALAATSAAIGNAGGAASSIEDGLKKAQAALDSGAALKKLEELVTFTQKFAA